jgi:hypothetical protein
MAGASTHVNYTSDDGTVYRLKMDLSNATAAGNPTATSSLHLPGGYEPRHVNASHPTSGRERRIVISDPGSGLWVGGTNVITLTDFSTTPSQQTAYNVLSRVGEKRLNIG